MWWEFCSVTFNSLKPSPFSESKWWIWSKTDFLILNMKLGVGSFPVIQRKNGLTVMRNTTVSVSLCLPSGIPRPNEEEGENLELVLGWDKLTAFQRGPSSQPQGRWIASISEAFMFPVNISWTNRRQALGWLHRGNGKDRSTYPGT